MSNFGLLPLGSAHLQTPFSMLTVASVLAYYEVSESARSSGAADFVPGQGDFLNTADHADFNMTGVSFWMAGFLNIDVKGANRIAFGKALDGDIEYYLTFINSTDRMRFIVSKDGSTKINVEGNSAGSPLLDTWFHTLVWVDTVADASGFAARMRINNDPVGDVAAFTGTLHSSTSDFTVGAGAIGGQKWNGLIDSVVIGKSPPGGIKGVIDDIQAFFYNDGNGRKYVDLSAQQKIDWGVISFWDLDEGPNETRADAHNGHDLLNNGTVNAGTGVPDGKRLLDKASVTVLNDLANPGAGGNFLNQSGVANRPLFRLGKVGGRPGIQGDGVDDGLIRVGSYLPSTNFSVVMVANFTDVTTQQVLMQSSDSSPDKDTAIQVEAGTIRFAGNDNGVSDSVSIAIATGDHIIIGTFDGTTANIYVDGVTGTGNDGAGVAPTDGTILGARTSGAAQFLGSYSEYGAYNAVLDASQRSQIFSELGAKYGITIT